MVQRAPLTPINLLESGAQLGHRHRGKSIQHAGNRRLVGKRVAAPSGGERRVRPETGVDLLDGRTIREHTDHHVKQFLVGLMDDGLAAELDMLPQRGKEISMV
jgi:hypothetical protein